MGNVVVTAVELLPVEESLVHEVFYEKGWTDGLPVVAPTPQRVDAMLAAASLAEHTVLGTANDGEITVTAGAVAVNAVMAGCRPDYFPIVSTAVRALLDPVLNAHVVLSSTGGAAMCVLVSGPEAERIGLNSGTGALGSGFRANATIGRCLRLLAINVIGARTGELDASSLGHPGKYTFCFAECPDPRWPTLREDLGYPAEVTTVTVFPAEGPRQVANHIATTGEGIMRTYATALRNPSAYGVGKGGHEVILVVGPEHADVLIESGWDRASMRDYLLEATRLLPAELAAAGLPPGELGTAHDQTPDPDGRLTTIKDPHDLWIVTAGGPGSGWSSYIPGFFPMKNGRAATAVVPAITAGAQIDG
jgi:hypothetical protein